MKIEDFKKLTKAQMTDKYKDLLQDLVDLEGSVGAKDALDEVKKNYEILNSEHDKLKKLNSELSTMNGRYVYAADKNNEIQHQMKIKIDELEAELESKTVPQTEPEDGDLDGVPWSQLPENKLVEVVRAQGAMLNKQARKLKKYKKQKK